MAATLLLLGALFISACSLGFEHIGGYQPCQLCYIQRHVHYALIPLTLVTLLTVWRNLPPLVIRLAFIILAGVLVYGAAVGVYQAGAEWEFWLGPNDCANTVPITTDASNLLAQLRTTKLISCDVAQLRILGLSFGGWNAVLLQHRSHHCPLWCFPFQGRPRASVCASAIPWQLDGSHQQELSLMAQ